MAIAQVLYGQRLVTSGSARGSNTDTGAGASSHLLLSGRKGSAMDLDLLNVRYWRSAAFDPCSTVCAVRSSGASPSCLSSALNLFLVVANERSSYCSNSRN